MEKKRKRFSSASVSRTTVAIDAAMRTSRTRYANVTLLILAYVILSHRTMYRSRSLLRSPLGGDVVFQKHATQRLDARRVPVEHRV
jgi:hypothetical protein